MSKLDKVKVITSWSSGEEMRTGHRFHRAFCQVILNGLRTDAEISNLRKLPIDRLHLKEGKQKCPRQLPFFSLQGDYCCSSLAQGLVIKQKALLMALVMQLTWQLYPRVLICMRENAALILIEPFLNTSHRPLWWQLLPVKEICEHFLGFEDFFRLDIQIPHPSV